MASVLVFDVLSRLQRSAFTLPSCNWMHMDQIPPPRSPRGWSRLDSCDPVNWLPLNTSRLMGCTWKSRPPDICSKPQRLVVYPLFMAPNRRLCSAAFTQCAKLGMAQSSGRGQISTKPPSRSHQKREGSRSFIYEVVKVFPKFGVWVKSDHRILRRLPQDVGPVSNQPHCKHGSEWR